MYIRQLPRDLLKIAFVCHPLSKPMNSEDKLLSVGRNLLVLCLIPHVIISLPNVHTRKAEFIDWETI